MGPFPFNTGVSYEYRICSHDNTCNPFWKAYNLVGWLEMLHLWCLQQDSKEWSLWTILWTETAMYYTKLQIYWAALLRIVHVVLHVLKLLMHIICVFNRGSSSRLPAFGSHNTLGIHLSWKTTPLAINISLKTGGLCWKVVLHWKKCRNFCLECLVFQNRWSVMAVISPDRFYCMESPWTPYSTVVNGPWVCISPGPCFIIWRQY